MVTPAKGAWGFMPRISFCLQSVYPVSGCCIGKLGASIYAVYAQHRREMRHGKVLLGVIEFWCGGNPLFPRSCPCWAGHGVSCDEERAIQSVKDAGSSGEWLVYLGMERMENLEIWMEIRYNWQKEG